MGFKETSAKVTIRLGQDSLKDNKHLQIVKIMTLLIFRYENLKENHSD